MPWNKAVNSHEFPVSLTDFGNFSRLTAGRHKAHGYLWTSRNVVTGEYNFFFQIHLFFTNDLYGHFNISASLISWILFVKGKRRLAWACLFALLSCPIQYICKAIQWLTHSSHCFNVCCDSCECDWLPNDNCLFYQRIHQIWYWLLSATSFCSMTSGASRAGECQLTHSRVLWSSTAKFSVWDSIVVTGAILELSCSQEAFTANFYLQSVQGEFFLFAVCSHAVIIYFGGLGLALYWG